MVGGGLGGVGRDVDVSLKKFVPRFVSCILNAETLMMFFFERNDGF